MRQPDVRFILRGPRLVLLLPSDALKFDSRNDIVGGANEVRILSVERTSSVHRAKFENSNSEVRPALHAATVPRRLLPAILARKTPQELSERADLLQVGHIGSTGASEPSSDYVICCPQFLVGSNTLALVPLSFLRRSTDR